MANPVGITRANFLSPQELTDGVLHSINSKGGFQEFATILERNSLPVYSNANANAPYDGFTLSDDKWSSGRRRVGMLVYVLETNKLYSLLPVGYFGNGGNLGEAEWDVAPEWERAVRIDPSGGFKKESPSPGNGFNPANGNAADLGISNDPNGCWVELTLGGGAATVEYDARNGTLSLYDGNTLLDSTPINSGNLFKFYAPTNTYYKVDADSDYEGGAAFNQNPTIYVTRGETYTFRREEAGHPLQITTSADVAVAGGVGAGVNAIDG